MYTGRKVTWVSLDEGPHKPAYQMSNADHVHHTGDIKKRLRSSHLDICNDCKSLAEGTQGLNSRKNKKRR